MKRRLLILGVMISCLLGLTGCGEETQYNTVEGSKYQSDIFNLDNIRSYAEHVEDNYFESWYLQGTTPENFEELHYFDIALNTSDSNYEVLAKGYDSWYKAVNDLGYNSIESLQYDIGVDDVRYYINGDGVLVAETTISGTKHSAEMDIYFTNRGEPTEIGVTVNKTTGEKLQNAGLNTLLGMGMAFSILIIISLIISIFPLFSGGGKKKETDKEITQKSMENVTSQIAEQEELTSDAELVAVIAAAIAAYESANGGSAEGFVVRSIRKKNNNWKKI